MFYVSSEYDCDYFETFSRAIEYAKSILDRRYKVSIRYIEN